VSFERPDVGRSPVAGPFRRAAAGSWAHDIPLELLGLGVQKKNRTCVGFGVQVQDVCDTGQLECPGDWHAQAKTNST